MLYHVYDVPDEGYWRLFSETGDGVAYSCRDGQPRTQTHFGLCNYKTSLKNDLNLTNLSYRVRKGYTTETKCLVSRCELLSEMLGARRGHNYGYYCWFISQKSGLELDSKVKSNSKTKGSPRSRLAGQGQHITQVSNSVTKYLNVALRLMIRIVGYLIIHLSCQTVTRHSWGWKHFPCVMTSGCCYVKLTSGAIPSINYKLSLIIKALEVREIGARDYECKHMKHSLTAIQLHDHSYESHRGITAISG